MTTTANLQSISGYCLINLLANMGQPSKKGIFGKRHIDGRVLKIVLVRNVQIAMGMAVASHEIGLRIATSLAAEESKEIVDHLLEFAAQRAEVNLSRTPDALPWEAIGHAELEGFPDGVMPWSQFLKQWGSELEASSKGAFLEGVAWALEHPAEFEEALNRDREEYEERAPFWKQRGSTISAAYAWLTNDDFYASCMDITRRYELSVSRLPTYPAV